MFFTSVLELLKNKNLSKGEALCIDVGLKKNGYAFSVNNLKTAIQGGIIKENLEEEVILKMKEKNCLFVILGFPFGWENTPSANRILLLAKKLVKNGVTVLLYDENHTSVQVKSVIYEGNKKMTKKQKQNYDAGVATLILQNALDEIQSFLKIC